MHSQEYLHSLVHELRNFPNESEWLEFKHNKANKDDIGKYISALSNSALLCGKDKAYMLWGIDDENHDIVGTSFAPGSFKIGNEELENWLLQRLEPKINFRFYQVEVEDKRVVLLEIAAAAKHPVKFINEEYIRIGSYLRKLKDFREKERDIWRLLDTTPFELIPAKEHLGKEQVFELLDYSTYFDLLKNPVPDGYNAILEALMADDIVVKDDAGTYGITNLGAILLAKNLDDFPTLQRKAIRVIQYKENNKLQTLREQVGKKGYASGFTGLIESIMNMVPTEERIDTPLREDVSMFPKLAVRELVANALIHQDFHVTGTGVMVEIFSDRMEITNPGTPLVDVERFLDAPPKSRNEKLASLMRRFGICEERGSGIDKVIFQVEMNQLPAPLFEKPLDSTRVVLFSHRELKNLTKSDRIRACYFHASLKYIERDYMTNGSLRDRFGIDAKNGAMASRIINDALQSELICIYDETVGQKARKYIPGWARG